MGNAAMCVPSTISNHEVKIICSDGRLLVFTRAPIKAADIMLEFPGQFLCESSRLKVGQRVPGICAEEELESGQVYFLLPMDLLYSVLTSEEFVFFTSKTRKGTKNSSTSAATLNFSKIFPEFCLFPAGSDGKGVKEEEYSDENGGGISLQKRYSRQRSWQPALETIVETTPPRY